MIHRRFLALTLATLAVALSVAPVLGAKPPARPDEPIAVGGGPADDEPWIPPTEDQQALLDVRLAEAAQVESSTAGDSAGSIQPLSFCATSATADSAADSPSPGDASAITASGCVYVPRSYALLTYARNQNNGYYCGPATAQVIINHSRGIYSSDTNGENAATNYRKQSYIATRLLWYNSSAGRWENTNTIGQTNAYMLRNGLNELADLPSGFAYAVVPTGTGSEWHAKIITETYTWHMAFAASVKMTSTTRRLVSWSPIAKGTTVRHWLAIRGYNGLWDGTDAAKVLYNDSTAYLGGGTGSYSDSSLKFWQLNTSHTARVVW
ncbi:MAG TPA: hypothetical protein VFM74_03820 [Candidatus Limnocylindria bacterium]|nr:hypothetical protein [Candidatus Limnocylindria bacterium]